MKKYLHYLFPAVLIAGLCILGYRKILLHGHVWAGFGVNADVLFIGLYLLWILYELKVSRIDVTQKQHVSDFGTREVYALAHGLTILSALWFRALWPKPGMFHLIGFFVFAGGVFFRVWAVSTLGMFYSHVVRTVDDHRIIDTGPYAYLRHPAYTGMIAAHLGVTLFYLNYVTPAVFSLMLVPSIVVRITVEERTLMDIGGYREFAAGRKRIIPFVW